MVNFKLGETNVKMKLSTCYEGGTKKTLLLVTFEIMLERHNGYLTQSFNVS